MADSQRLTYEQIAALLTRIQASEGRHAAAACLMCPASAAGHGVHERRPRVQRARDLAGLRQLLHAQSHRMTDRLLHFMDGIFSFLHCALLAHPPAPALPAARLAQERFGWQPIIEGGNIIGLTQNGQVSAHCGAGWLAGTRLAARGLTGCRHATGSRFGSLCLQGGWGGVFG